jgi:hypothetical protein
MVVHRAPTRYSRVRDVTILDDEEDHIELIQHPRLGEPGTSLGSYLHSS